MEKDIKLQKNEYVLWKGYPKKGFQLVFEDLIIIPFFGILFSIFLYISFRSDSMYASLLVLGFLSLLIYFRYISDIIKRKSTVYFVTSERVVILKYLQEISITYPEIDKISYIEHPFGYTYGSIIFGEEETIFGKVDNSPFEWQRLLGTRSGINLKRDEVSIAFIKNYKEVYNLVQSQLAKKNVFNKE